ncbi:hypothetical protein, partial [Flammeovirga aprica]
MITKLLDKNLVEIYSIWKKHRDMNPSNYFSKFLEEVSETLKIDLKPGVLKNYIKYREFTSKSEDFIFIHLHKEAIRKTLNDSSVPLETLADIYSVSITDMQEFINQHIRRSHIYDLEKLGYKRISDDRFSIKRDTIISKEKGLISTSAKIIDNGKHLTISIGKDRIQLGKLIYQVFSKEPLPTKHYSYHDLDRFNLSFRNISIKPFEDDRGVLIDSDKDLSLFPNELLHKDTLYKHSKS